MPKISNLGGDMKYSRPKTIFWSFLVICLCLMNLNVNAQTTGKIAGMVYDDATKEPAFGANVFLEGTYLGAAVDSEGSFFILNVTPGSYTLVVQMIGYETVKVEDLRVSVNRTAVVDINLKPTIMETDEVIVVAKKIAIKKDQTSSIKNVSSEDILALPVEDLDQVVEMQAGVVDGHFRGGRLTEVSYLIDGMQVNESYNKGLTSDGAATTSKMVNIEPEAVQDLEVITGTFNAEYGRAMSGIVNMVTKDGSNELHGSFTGYSSNYFTSNSDVWIGLNGKDAVRNQDYKVQLEGPIWRNKITFFTNFRYQKNLGYINGIRRFNVDDYSDFTTPNSFVEETPWDAYVRGTRYYSEHTGDGTYVPINTSKTYSFMGKLSFRLASDLKMSLMSTWNYDERPTTGHVYKYKPDGRANYYDETFMYVFQLNHLISQSIFHDLKISYTENEYKFYLYENPLDSRYVHRGYDRSVGGFASGGQDYDHHWRTLDDLNIKYDLSWQINNKHFIKTGIYYTSHRLHNEPTHVQNALEGTPLEYFYDYDPNIEKVWFYPYRAVLEPDSAISMDVYTKKPYEFSGYIQDKMEFDEMVINLGVRLDYFNSNTTYPSQRRNPANQLTFYQKDEYGNNIVDADSNLILDPVRMSTYPKADPQIQISPRFGLSYSLGEVAVLHFSYGHFFQMPPLYALYSNYRFLIPPGNFGTIHGNPEIKAEKTVQYEMGIWMELMPRMGLELSVYYKDIYDLQSAVVYTTYNQIQYGLYSNKDYGNAKGFELKYDYGFEPFSLYLNYTLQYTRGNADNPRSTYNRISGESGDPIPYLIPLNWDQRHTINGSIFYSGNNYGITLTGYVNSGRPFTFTPESRSPLARQTLYPNNSTRPTTYTLDLKGHYDFDLGNAGRVRLSLSIYNLLDTMNELYVNSSTGRANTDIIYPVEIQTFRSNFNDIYDSIRNPYQFSAPREVKLGLGYMF